MASEGISARIGQTLELRRTRDGWLKTGLKRHMQSAVFALGQLARTWGSTLLTVLVIAVALAFPSGLYVVLKNSTRIATQWDGQAELTLHLQGGATDEIARELARELEAWPELSGIIVLSPEQSLADFEQRADMPGLVDLLGGSNPLPYLLTANVRKGIDPRALDELLGRAQAKSMVELAELDLAWLRRLSAILTVIERAVQVLAGLLAVGVILIVGNSIRVGIDTRREEIEIALLFGATAAFIRRPFVYGGILIGAAGAALAWAIVSVCLGVLESPLDRLSRLYTGDIGLEYLSLAETGGLLLGGVVLGASGAAVAVGRHLRSITPS